MEGYKIQTNGDRKEKETEIEGFEERGKERLMDKEQWRCSVHV